VLYTEPSCQPDSAQPRDFRAFSVTCGSCRRGTIPVGVLTGHPCARMPLFTPSSHAIQLSIMEYQADPPAPAPVPVSVSVPGGDGVPTLQTVVPLVAKAKAANLAKDDGMSRLILMHHINSRPGWSVQADPDACPRR